MSNFLYIGGGLRWELFSMSNECERQQWVVSGLSPSYQFNDRYRV